MRVIRQVDQIRTSAQNAIRAVAARSLGRVRVPRQDMKYTTMLRQLGLSSNDLGMVIESVARDLEQAGKSVPAPELTGEYTFGEFIVHLAGGFGLSRDEIVVAMTQAGWADLIIDIEHQHPEGALFAALPAQSPGQGFVLCAVVTGPHSGFMYGILHDARLKVHSDDVRIGSRKWLFTISIPNEHRKIHEVDYYRSHPGED